MSTLKNWWFALLGMLAVVLDQGFEVLNPFLIEIGLPEKWIWLVKLIFGLYGIYRVKKELPTQNADRLIQQIGGTNPPPVKDEK